jgi:hypothetical protein
MADVGATSIVSEITKTSGTGPYTVIKSRARAAKFAQFYSPGDTFDYFVEDGGGLAEHGQGTLNLDGTISRTTIHWTSVGGIGGAPVNWFEGRKYISAVVTGGGGTTISAAERIRGFWDGIITDGKRIDRFLFTKTATLKAGLPLSLATCDTPPASGGGTTSYLIGAGGNRLVKADLTSKLVKLFGSGAGPAVFSLQKNASQIGTMVFGPGVAPATGYLVDASGDRLLRAGGGFLVRSFGGGSPTQATFNFPSDVSFVAGDKFEIVGPVPGDANLANLVWTFELS